MSATQTSPTDSSSATTSANQAIPAEKPQPTKQPKGLRFWLILVSLLLGTFLGVLEAYAVSTALPTIVNDLKATDFIWVASAYAISSTVLLPLIGSISEVFGRRPVILVALCFFAVGAAVSGAAQSMNMLIAGRVLHGIGSGGIYSLSQIILSDLVTLAERGTYNGLFSLMWAVAGGIGPVIGGAFSRPTTWRWLFYLNVPAAGIILFILILFLRLKRPILSQSSGELWTKLDIPGNVLIIGASCSCAIALAWGGVQFSWTSAPVLAPLCIGAVGLIGWVIFEWRFAQIPAVPLKVLGQRTSLSGYIQIFVAAFININLLYYLPVYYQATKDDSPIASGVALFALCFATGPAAIIAGISISKTHRYRPQIWVAWVLLLVGVGLLSTITENTSRGASAGYQLITGFGIGMLYSATYFPVLAPIAVTMNGPAIAFYVFVRSFAQIWGVTIGGAVLQNELSRHLPTSLQNVLPGFDDSNIAYAVVPLIGSLEQPLKDTVRHVFADSLAVVWRIQIGVAGVGFLASLLMQGLPLHTVKDEAKGLQTEKLDADDRVETS